MVSLHQHCEVLDKDRLYRHQYQRPIYTHQYQKDLDRGIRVISIPARPRYNISENFIGTFTSHVAVFGQPALITESEIVENRLNKARFTCLLLIIC